MKLSAKYTKFIPSEFGFFNKLIPPTKSTQFIEIESHHFVQIFEDETFFYFQRTPEGDHIASNKPFNILATATETESRLAIQIDWNERILHDRGRK